MLIADGEGASLIPASIATGDCCTANAGSVSDVAEAAVADAITGILSDAAKGRPAGSDPDPDQGAVARAVAAAATGILADPIPQDLPHTPDSAKYLEGEQPTAKKMALATG